MASNGDALLLASAPEDAKQQELQLTNGNGANAQADANGAAGSSATSSRSGAGGAGSGEGEELELEAGSKSSSARQRPLLFSVRFLIALLGFFGTLSLYSLRVNLSIALPCMVHLNKTPDRQYGAPNMSALEELPAVCQVAPPSPNATDPSQVRPLRGSTRKDFWSIGHCPLITDPAFSAFDKLI